MSLLIAQIFECQLLPIMLRSSDQSDRIPDLMAYYIVQGLKKKCISKLMTQVWKNCRVLWVYSMKISVCLNSQKLFLGSYFLSSHIQSLRSIGCTPIFTVATLLGTLHFWCLDYSTWILSGLSLLQIIGTWLSC